MTTKPLSKAAQARAEAAVQAQDKLAAEFQIFKETYAQKLFELASDWGKHVDSASYPSAQYDKDGFTFEYESHCHTSDVHLPHTIKVERFLKVKYDVEELESHLADIAEKRRAEQERLDKIAAAKDKARSFLTPEELKLIGL